MREKERERETVKKLRNDARSRLSIEKSAEKGEKKKKRERGNSEKD